MGGSCRSLGVAAGLGGSLDVMSGCGSSLDVVSGCGSSLGVMGGSCRSLDAAAGPATVARDGLQCGRYRRVRLRLTIGRDKY